MRDFVSILIPCFNAEQWVGKAIASALEQTWANKEVLVVDDGSSDGSLEVIKSFGDHIKWTSQPNAGSNVARNRLLAMSSGAWLQYLDADDYLLPEKISSQMEYIQQHTGVDVVLSPIILHIEEGKNFRYVRLRDPHPETDRWIKLVRWHTPQTGAFLYSRDALSSVGGWTPEQVCCQDNELTLRLLMNENSFAYCPSYGAVYRIWSENTLSNRSSVQTREERLRIIEQAENFLKRKGILNTSRLTAINQARCEIARSTWSQDRPRAYEIMQAVHITQPNFRPGAPIPRHYVIFYRLLGFKWTEWLAQCARSWFASARAVGLAGAKNNMSHMIRGKSS